MMSETIDTAIALARRLGDKLTIAEWLVIAEALTEGRNAMASDKVYGAWVKANFPALRNIDATAAKNCLAHWDEIEPLTLPGQPLATYTHPRRLWEAFKALTEAEETPAAEVVRVVKEIPATATVDSLAEYLEAFARDTGTSVDEARLLIDGLRLDLASRASSSPLAIARKVFATARDAASWLTFASVWANAGGRSIQLRVSRLRKAAPDAWPEVLASSIVETEAGFGINLSEAETLCSRETAARKALMEVPTGAVYGIRGIRLPGGDAPADAVFCVTDNAAMRKASGLVMGTLWFKESGADRIEGESASLPVEYLSGWDVIGGDVDPEDVPGFAADWLALSS